MQNISTLFEPNAQPLCAVKEWFVSDLGTTTRSAPTSVPYILTLQAARESKMGQLIIDSKYNIENKDFKTQFSVSIHLRATAAQTNLTIVHRFMANIEVNIGCFNVTRLEFIFKPNQDEHFVSFDSNTNTLVMRFAQKL